jgi:glycosyltransferase involved in cell wall biosynthesis
MKVGVVTSSLSPAGGWDRYSRFTSEAVSKLADEVRVLTLKDAKNEECPFKVYKVIPSIRFHPWVQFKIFLAVLKYLRGCDVIHTMVVPVAPGTAVACWLIRAKLVITMHGTYAIPPFQKDFLQKEKGLSIIRLFLRIAYRTASIVTTGSYRTEAKVRERTYLGECRFIPNGVSPVRFPYKPEIPRENFLLTVGEVKPRKGADLVTEAIGRLKDEFPDLGFKMVGGTGWRPYIEQIEAIADKYGIRDRLEFCGVIDDAELASLYQRCRASVLAARIAEGQFEGFPMVFYEALSCGAPLITSKGFGSEYVVQNGENGFLIEEENVEQLVECIRKLMSNKDLQKNMTEKAVESALKHTWDRIAEEHVVPMYNDALKK